MKNGGKLANVLSKYKDDKFKHELADGTIRNIVATPAPGVDGNNLKANDTVQVNWERIAENDYTYEKITKVKIRETVSVVVVCNGTKGKVSVKIHENPLDKEAIYDNPIEFIVGSNSKNYLEFEFNEDDGDRYAQDIIIRPASEEALKSLVEKYNKRTDRTALLYFKTDFLDNPEAIEFPAGSSGEFLNNEGEHFELIGSPCLCNRHLDTDDMIDLVYFLRSKQKMVTYREKFFDQKTEYISDIRIITGKLTDNKPKIKMFVDEMNSMFEKFGINTCRRKIHFLAQMYLETISFRATYEGRSSVPDNYKGGVDFQGRGMKQITHDYNYLAYYDYVNGTSYFSEVYMKYRKDFESVGECADKRKSAQEAGLTKTFYDNTLKAFAKNLSENLFHSFNSAGWFSTVYNTKVLSKMDAGLTDSDVEKVTIEINGGVNNLTERTNYTKWLKEYLNYDTQCINK